MTTHYLGDYVPLLEAKLGIKPGFFKSLDDDDENDWSFVIKLHALVEAAVSHLLTEQLHRSELSGLFARLEISNETTGKAAFVKALALLEGLDSIEVLVERGNTLHNLGLAKWLEQDLQNAERYLREALEIRRALGDLEKVGDTLQNLGLDRNKAYEIALEAISSINQE